MQNSPSKIPAYIVLRLVALVLVTAGAALIFNAEILADRDYPLLVIGGLTLFFAAVGPVRITLKGAQVPAEIKSIIRVQAIVISCSGLSFVSAAVMNTSPSAAYSYAIVGLLLLISAVFGFYALSNKLPHTFYIGEMLSIIKSAGITGNIKDSAADHELMRWTNGVREGVSLGAPAPDGSVLTLQGEQVLLSSFFGDDSTSPLVLNFGSYTCPHHRKRLDQLSSLMLKWQDRNVRFLTIYTAEAHTVDGWELPRQYESDAEYTNETDFCFIQTTSMDERKKMTEWMVEKKHFKMPIVIDSMENVLQTAYNSWPIRMYIILDNKVAYCGDQGPFGYDPTDVERALNKLLN